MQGQSILNSIIISSKSKSKIKRLNPYVTLKIKKMNPLSKENFVDKITIDVQQMTTKLGQWDKLAVNANKISNMGES